MTATAFNTGEDDSGFTLLELIVVLGILALTASLVFPRAQSANSATALESAARRLASALQLAHAESRRTNTDQSIFLDVDHSTFWSSAAPTREAIPKTIAFTFQDDGFEWAGPSRRIRFTPSGGATGGTITLANATAQARITIDWLTGSTTLTTSR